MPEEKAEQKAEEESGSGRSEQVTLTFSSLGRLIKLADVLGDFIAGAGRALSAGEVAGLRDVAQALKGAKSTTYEGWSNYETWTVKQAIDNDKGIYERVHEWVKTTLDGLEYGIEDLGHLSIEETKRYAVADAVKEYLEALVDGVTIGGVLNGTETECIGGLKLDEPEAEMLRELLRSAVIEVDYQELAEELIKEVEKV
jgi:hypothetical protein